MEHIRQFPHCDPRVLHAPEDNCEFCNHHPDWQELRKYWRIAFTGHSYDENGSLFADEYGNLIQPCPAEVVRGIKSINSWGGNIPHTPEVAQEQKKHFEGLKELFKGRFGFLPSKTDDLGYDPEELDESVGSEPTFGKRVTLSGESADPDYVGGAPQPIDPKTGQHKDYWVLAPEERAKGFVRPIRTSYKHEKCGTLTSMGDAIAETYARDPKFYGSTFCSHCMTHYPVGQNGEFVWLDGSKVGS